MGSEGNKNGVVEVLPWLKGLALAPEYHPTIAEFQDPIAYIYKIEKEASRYGICKIVPPLVSASRKTAIANLNRSLIARPGSDGPTFTTRQQQIGFCPRRHNRPVQKPVWQSGERYTVEEFEAKAKGFEKSYLKKFVSKKSFSGLEIESLFWKATADKPFSVEYANDMPGSAFSVRKESSSSGNGNGGNVTVGETDWNMRGVSRAKGSLLRFMKEEIPGVTSPMVYIAMMFSWFAWHAEDHDLHSLNYLHTGAGKTWYGVPKDAAVAFEDVIRTHGYGGEVNPLVTFEKLGEKTTVMSPQVLIDAGIPCCRLVQNPGEFVVTFPRAYHSGFSHGFNCGEAANIATPEWLATAKDAAIRRASINSPPMVSHFQLLYDLAHSLCSRVPKNMCMEPRSSRLKEKKKSEGEILIKDLFVHDVLRDNNLLHVLGKGSSVVILPRISSSKSVCSDIEGGFQSKVKARLFTSLGSPDLEVKTRKSVFSEDNLLDKNQGSKHVTGSRPKSIDFGRDADQCDRVTKQGLFSCVTCGILCFASVAMIQPTTTASQYLMSGDCSIFNDWEGGTTACNEDTATPGDSPSGRLFDVPVESAAEIHQDTSSLGLLALAYGSSESEDDEAEADVPAEACLDVIPLRIDDSCAEYGLRKTKFKSKYGKSTGNSERNVRSEHVAPDSSLGVPRAETAVSPILIQSGSTNKPFAPELDQDSSRMHIFCLQHAVQVEQQLRAIGGARVVLLCHPDYPELEAKAKKVAEELGTNHPWSNISFREASKEDEEMIHSAMDSEEAIHGNGDWAVKLGVNLYYSANLSRSPLYSKQMPYNRVIYNAFGCRTGHETEADQRCSGRQKKIVVAGRWCGKVWMSNQVHPLLAERVLEEQEQERDIPGPVENDLNLQTPSEGTNTAEATHTTYKMQRKRKTFSEPRSVEAESLDAEESEEEDFLLVSCKQQKNKRERKRKTSAEPRSVVEAESLDGEESEEDFLLVSFKQQKNNLRNKRMKKDPRVKSVGNSNLKILGESSKQDEDNLRKLQMKSKRNCEQHDSHSEDEGEDFEVLQKSGKRHTNNHRKRQRNGRNCELDPHPEDELEGLEVLPKTGKQRTKNPRSKQIEKETPEPKTRGVRNRNHLDSHTEDELEGGPSTRLRKRTAKQTKGSGTKAEVKPYLKVQTKSSKAKKVPAVKTAVCSNNTKVREEAECECDMESCNMSFSSKQELILHKKNICPVKGCGKKFFSHKYLVQHQRVHMDARPLKCPWKGCKMTFKWAWARTEHIRVHTGARPYVCAEPGCGQTFRFVSDFSRHKRKTGHAARMVSHTRKKVSHTERRVSHTGKVSHTEKKVKR